MRIVDPQVLLSEVSTSNVPPFAGPARAADPRSSCRRSNIVSRPVDAASPSARPQAARMRADMGSRRGRMLRAREQLSSSGGRRRHTRRCIACLPYGGGATMDLLRA